MADPINLFYFDGRGKAEIIRLTLSYLGLEFTETDFTDASQLAKLRADGHLLYQQVPMLQIGDRRIVQTGAIVRYLARRGGIYGKDNDESTRVDEVYEGTRDFYTPVLAMVFLPEETQLKELKTKTLPRYLPAFNKVLEGTGTGFTVGSSLTLADLGLFEVLQGLVEYLGETTFEGFPNIQKFYKNMTANEKISSFLKGPHRKGKNDQAYVDNVKKVFAW